MCFLCLDYVTVNKELYGTENQSTNESTDEEIENGLDNELKTTENPGEFTEEHKELDLDLNMVANTLLSHAEQNGQASSVSAILESLGLSACISKYS